MEILFRDLSYCIVGAAMEVHATLGPGFLEAVYAESLAHEFRLRDLGFRREIQVPVRYKGILVGDYKADFVVEKTVLLEVKAVACLNDSHKAQAHNYLAGTGLQLGIVINFGARQLEYKRVLSRSSGNS